MKVVLLALVLSVCSFASEREKRWEGFQNPNKIEAKQLSIKNNKAHKSNLQNNKVQLKTSKILKSLFTAM
jgi:hypothetical protein